MKNAFFITLCPDDKYFEYNLAQIRELVMSRLIKVRDLKKIISVSVLSDSEWHHYAAPPQLHPGGMFEVDGHRYAPETIGEIKVLLFEN